MDGYAVPAVPGGTSSFGSNPKLNFPAFGSKSAADKLLDYVPSIARLIIGRFAKLKAKGLPGHLSVQHLVQAYSVCPPSKLHSKNSWPHTY